MRALWWAVLLAIVMAVAVYLWLGSLWAGVAALAFVGTLGLGTFALLDEVLTALQLEVRAGLQDLGRRLTDLHGATVIRLDSLREMAEFVGEQSYPNFATAVETFRDAQEEERQRQKQLESKERAFKETLDAAVRNARTEREKEASAAREAFRRSRTEKEGTR